MISFMSTLCQHMACNLMDGRHLQMQMTRHSSSIYVMVMVTIIVFRPIANFCLLLCSGIRFANCVKDMCKLLSKPLSDGRMCL